MRDGLVREGLDSSSIEVIPNAVEPPASPGGPDPLEREFGVDPGRPVIGVVARLVRVKGLEYFIEAAARLSERFPEAVYALVGGPIADAEERDGKSYETELQELAAARGVADRVLFMGYRRDVPRLLSRFTVSVLPSLSEGLSNTLLESMAAGVPVVATEVGGSPEVVEDGVNGLLVPPGDGDALAAAIGRLLADPEHARDLAAAGRERVTTHFTPSALVDRTAAAYRTILGGSGARSLPGSSGTPTESNVDLSGLTESGGSGPWSWKPIRRRH